MGNSWYRAIWIAVAIGLWPGLIAADVIELKNGKFLHGEITNQNRTHVFLRTDRGQVVVPKSTLLRIRYEESADTAKSKAVAVVLPKPAGRKAPTVPEKPAAVKEPVAAKPSGKENTKSTPGPLLPDQSSLTPGSQRTRLETLPTKAFLFPGWGHWDRGQRTEAVIFGTTAGTLLLGGIAAHEQSLRLRADYKSEAVQTYTLPLLATSDVRPSAFAVALVANRSNYRSYSARVAQRDRAITAFALVYAIQLGHAAVYLAPTATQGSRQGGLTVALQWPTSFGPTRVSK